MDWILLAQDTAVEASDELHRFDALVDVIMSPRGHFLFSALFMGIGMYLLLPPRGRGPQFYFGAALAAVGVVLFLLPTLSHLPVAPAFFLMEGLAVLGGLGTVTSRNPVYSAIWFASAVLAVGGLLLMNGAQFLGLATVAVYAGAIVVTFLFVLMLAQPEGHAVYDRLGWGWFPTMCASIAGVSVPAMLAVGLVSGHTHPAASELHVQVAQAIAQTRTEGASPSGATSQSEATVADDSGFDDGDVHSVQLTRDALGAPLLKVTLAAESGLLSRGEATLARSIRATVSDLHPSTQISIGERDILTDKHVARLGGELFGRQLIAVQVAAILLLVALVAAIAMAVHGKDLSRDISRKADL